ncbi:MAG: hypothetical protein Q9183_003069 [Haloplaca sp. 2 TL-2023]
MAAEPGPEAKKEPGIGQQAGMVVLYSQILHGCSDPRCRTPTCLTCQKRTTKRPLRSFTALSARTLATALALEEDAERHLCPYKASQDGVASSEAAQPEDQLPVDENASCKKSKDGIGDHATGSSSKPSKRIDTKSFAQVLFDTQAFQTFYGDKSPQNVSNNLPSPGSQALPVQEQVDRPQTLSHFSLANLEALVKFSRTCLRTATEYDPQTPFRISAPGLVPELVRSRARQSAPDALKKFVDESITYILSKPANLLQSFPGEASQTSDGVPTMLSLPQEVRRGGA